MWSDQGQIFVKLGETVTKLNYANKDEILRKAREARVESEEHMELAAENRNTSSSPSPLPVEAVQNSPVRGFGRGVLLNGSPQDSSERGRGRGRGRGSPTNT